MQVSASAPCMLRAIAVFSMSMYLVNRDKCFTNARRCYFCDPNLQRDESFRLHPWIIGVLVELFVDGIRIHATALQTIVVESASPEPDKSPIAKPQAGQRSAPQALSRPESPNPNPQTSQSYKRQALDRLRTRIPSSKSPRLDGIFQMECSKRKVPIEVFQMS